MQLHLLAGHQHSNGHVHNPHAGLFKTLAWIARPLPVFSMHAVAEPATPRMSCTVRTPVLMQIALLVLQLFHDQA